MWVIPDQEKVRDVLLKDKRSETVIQESIGKLNLVQTFNRESLKEVLECYYKENGFNMKRYMTKLRCCLSDQKVKCITCICICTTYNFEFSLPISFVHISFLF